MFAELQDVERHDKYHRAIVATVAAFREEHGGEDPVVVVLNDDLGIRAEMAVRAGAARVVVFGGPPSPTFRMDCVEWIDALDASDPPVADVAIVGVRGNNVPATRRLLGAAKAAVRHGGRYCIPRSIEETVTPCAWNWAAHDADDAAERARGAFFRDVIGRLGARGLVSTADAPVLPATYGRVRFASTGPTTKLSKTGVVAVSGEGVPAIAVGWTATLSDGVVLDNTPDGYASTPLSGMVARATECGLYVAGGLAAGSGPLKLVHNHRSIEGIPVLHLESADGMVVWSNGLKATRRDDEIKHLLGDIATTSPLAAPPAAGTLYYDAPTAAIMAAAADPARRHLVACPSLVARSYILAHHPNLAVATTVNRLHVSRDKVWPVVVTSHASRLGYPRLATRLEPDRVKEALALGFDPAAAVQHCCPAAPTATAGAIRLWLGGRQVQPWLLRTFPWTEGGEMVVVAQYRVGGVGGSGINDDPVAGHAMAVVFGPEKIVHVG